MADRWGNFFAAIVAMTVWLVGPIPFASAEGGSSIASAPAVVIGEQEFGNTANGPYFHGSYHSFWGLGLAGGDKVVIDWEAIRTDMWLRLYPPSTSDFNLEQADPIKQQQPSSNGKNEMRFTPSQGGVFPLIVEGRYSGIYSFTVFVKHALTVIMPRLSRLPHRGELRVQVHSPEGTTISDSTLKVNVEARAGRTWKKIGSAPVSNSIAEVSVKVPRTLWHKRVSLRATALGQSYIKTHSRSERVSVP